MKPRWIKVNDRMQQGYPDVACACNAWPTINDGWEKDERSRLALDKLGATEPPKGAVSL